MSDHKNSRRRFLAQTVAAGTIAAMPLAVRSGQMNLPDVTGPEPDTVAGDDITRQFNGPYEGKYLNRVAFPIGGIGAGMFSMEGTGAIAQMSVNHRPDVYNEPCTFAALHIMGPEGTTKVLEGPVPDWKKYGQTGGGRNAPANGAGDNSFGLPRFNKASFESRFPFGTVRLKDDEIPLEVAIRGWSPFIPTNADDSSLPVGAFEYLFKNTSDRAQACIFSWNAKNFMKKGANNRIRPLDGGFILEQGPFEKSVPQAIGSFAAFVDEAKATADYSWFRGGWFDSLSLAWDKITAGDTSANGPVESDSPGASLYVPFTLKPGESRTIALKFAWYVPDSDLRFAETNGCEPNTSCVESETYRPWYAGRFDSIDAVADYWNAKYAKLQSDTQLFTETFYKTTLPDEVTEAIAANLGILKSPTVLRQTDGNLWAFEGCTDMTGCCHGSCTHVWNYAQALPHLFPALERTLRETEFKMSQNDTGHQTFRSALPIRKVEHTFHAAADGQLGGIMKVYREWRTSGSTEWMAALYPRIKSSLDFCIATWDPEGKGILEEPHHNTYDIEFWGPDGMCTSIYLGALTAMVEMSKALGKDHKEYLQKLKRGTRFMEEQLFDGEYFNQKIQWTGLRAKNPVALSEGVWNTSYSEEAKALLEKEGPKYQYGKGCLSDGIIGMWLASCCGLEEAVDGDKVRSHLRAVYKYNLLRDMRDHINPQRPSFAMGDDGGLLLCSWPKGGKLSLPFVYSNEVWTGIEYQVASHLMMKGLVKEGLEIVQTCRKRYDGSVRNPFDEYECGHWYARALASYSLIQGLTGVRYDAVDKTLFINSKVGNDFTAFLSVESGFGNFGLKDGKPFIEMAYGRIDAKRINVSGKEFRV
jgi:uncharacterized protein (DUF608 family)